MHVQATPPHHYPIEELQLSCPIVTAARHYPCFALAVLFFPQQIHHSSMVVMNA
jgi:hypothetical protein